MPQIRLKKQNRPLRVGYDIVRMSAGGANGGIKAHHYEFMRHFAEHYGRKLSLVVFCREEIVPELSFLSAGPFNQIHVIGDKSERDYRDGDGSLPPLQFWPGIPEQFLEKLDVDLLYCGFGYSDLWTPKIPQISLIVDALHKDLPEALPPAEVAHRERWYQEAIARSAFVQTNSDFCVQSLMRHYNVPAKKLFRIYLPLNDRYNRVNMGSLPSNLSTLQHRYFLYPANFWPHKNHLTLLEAYRVYLDESEREPHHLALSGHPGEQQDEIKQRVAALGLEGRVHFLGHLSLSDFKAVWEFAAALVFPSLYEGFGLPILEAMHFQKPIACSNAASLPEITPKTAITFDPNDATQIAAALLQLATNPEAHQAEPAQLQRFDLAIEARALLQKLESAARPEA